MRSFGATPRFYIERLRIQIAHARGRRYPDVAGGVPAKWLAYLAAQLDQVAANVKSDDCSPLEAEQALETIAACYSGLHDAEKAHTGEVAYYVVSGLKRWFDAVDPTCGYLFTSGKDYELNSLLDEDSLKRPEIKAAAIAADLDKTVYAVTMPGGALGSAFHIPLVAHEAGHVLADKLGTKLIDRLEGCLRREDLPLIATDEAKAIIASWMTEIFGDTVCAYMTGPAGFFALHEELRGSTIFDDTYPPNRLRVQKARSFVRDRFGDVLDAQGVTSKDWDDWTAGPPVTEKEVADDRYAPIAGVFLRALDAIAAECAKVVEEFIPELAYTSEQLAFDLDAYVVDFYHAILPIEKKDKPHASTGIATILNVAWFIAAFRLDKMMIKVSGGDGKLLVMLDDLVFKAIELAESRFAWEDAA